MEKRGESLIYGAITLVSVVLCLFLGGIMMMDREETTTSMTKEQKFSEVEIVEEKPREIILTQEEIAGKLCEMLPESFPKNSVKMEINGNGRIYMGMTASRTDIEKMVKNGLGFKEKLMLRMLPESFEMGIFYNVSFDEEAAMLSFAVESLNLNGMRLESNMAPPEIPHEIAQAVNKVLLNSGYYFTKIEIADGKVILKP
ncbi:MAG: hypothetical protein IJN37_01135 [Clostridia bacterium]|nr:hypothetical protein [Clostridia bacterium]